MPTRVFRRTPASERAAIYGYKDLLKDSISLLREKASANVERMTSGGMSNEEIFETAMAPAGGMLKIAGLAKLLPAVIKAEKVAQTSLGRHNKVFSEFRRGVADADRGVFKEALKVPEKEYRRIRDIGWSSMKGEAPGTKGLYFPIEKDIAIKPGTGDLQTIWHEFTHARQWNPDKYSRLPGGGSEAATSYSLLELKDRLQKVTSSLGISPREFYFQISPIERHARGVAASVQKYPKDFETIYKYALKKETADSRARLHSWLKEAELDEAFMRGETEIQMALGDVAKAPREAKGLMKKFSKQGLKYDAFVNPLPDRPELAYHQWTFYGEGPLKRATFGTKTTGLGEMKAKVTDMMKKFSK